MDWQTLLDEIVFQSSKDIISEIKESNDLSNKVDICYKNIKIRNALKDWLAKCCYKKPAQNKSTQLSSKYRNTGNNFCKEKAYYSALKFYNKSLCYSIKGSEEEKQAYGNRSHVLLELSCFKEAVKDIDRVLEGSPPTLLREIKLLARKGEALVFLENYHEAFTTLSSALSKIELLDENIKKKSNKTLFQVVRFLEVTKAKMFSKDSSDLSEENLCSNFKNLCVSFCENPAFPGTSSALSILESETKGRHVVTLTDINIGDVLFKEEPFAFVVLPDMIDKYCTYCCKKVIAPVPCNDCPLASFCDERCRDKAMKDFHRWECSGMKLCYSIGIVHLSLRVALLGLLKDKADNYTRVTNLVSHINDVEPLDLYRYTLTALILVCYLEEYTDIFKGENRIERLINFGGTILLHIGQLICNGHAITDIQSEEAECQSRLLIEEQVRVATAIYPSASMMNHSCEPNIINSFFDNILVVRATKKILKGAEVFNCYGPMGCNTEFIKRQEILQNQYFFTCDCSGCIIKADPIADRLECDNCSAVLRISGATDICERCSHSIDIENIAKDLSDSDRLYNEGQDKLNKGEYREGYTLLMDSLQLREKHCYKTHRKLLECRDALATVNSFLDKDEDACHLIIKNISAIKDIYGKISVEVGQEIMKLLSVAINLCNKNKKLSSKQRELVTSCYHYGEDGVFLFELSYGNWHHRYNEMKKHFQYLHQFITS